MKRLGIGGVVALLLGGCELPPGDVPYEELVEGGSVAAPDDASSGLGRPRDFGFLKPRDASVVVDAQGSPTADDMKHPMGTHDGGGMGMGTRDLAMPAQGMPDLAKPGVMADASTGPSTPTGPVVRFVVIGDYGVGNNDPSNNEAHVAALVRQLDPDFIVTTGDNNYPSGEATTIDANIGQFYSDWIGEYHGIYGAGATDNRFWPALGNHDWYSAAGPTPIEPYLEYFTSLPGNRRYYDVDLGIVHLFVLNSHDPVEVNVPHEPDGWTQSSVQGQWLKGRLASSQSCYNVVAFHHPPYSSGAYNVPDMRWPYAEWGADVVFSGHEHWYERLQIDGIPYIIDGLGGANRFFSMNAPIPESQVIYNANWGAMLVTATSTSLSLEFWSVQGKLIDHLTVPKNCGVVP